MEPKESSCNYESFMAKNLESYAERGSIERQGRRIRACFHGWVILSDEDNVLWSLWNPLTSKLIRLPPLIRKEKYSYHCCLSSPPDDQGSVFLLFPDTSPIILFCRLDYELKTLKWSEMLYAEQLQPICRVENCFLQSPTCYNGMVYAITEGLKCWFVIQVDIVVKGNEVVISLLSFVPEPYLGQGSKYNRSPSRNNILDIRYFLKGSCTELFFIKVCFKNETRIGEMYLLKFNRYNTGYHWDEIHDLEDAIFFLDLYSETSYSVFYKSAVTSEIRGHVTILGEMDKIIYSFHVKDRTISLFSMPCIERESQVLAWAMLECGLEVDHRESKQEEQDTDIEIVTKPVKSDETKFDITNDQSRLLNVPFPILEMIMEYCVGVEYMYFRATCKRCRLASPLIQWSNKTILKRWQMHSVVSPWLMAFDKYRGNITFIDPIYGDKYFIKTPRELNGECPIFYSRHGWLLLYFKSRQLLFFNPFTRSIRKLPVVRYELGSICFSAPPTSPDCMVVGFTTHGPWNVYIHFVSQEFSWRTYQLDFGANDPLYFHIDLTFCGRDIYTLCKDERIYAFRDIDEHGYSLEVVKDKAPRSCRGSHTQNFLSKCDEHLLLVCVGECGESVEVFELNDSTKEWEKIDGLGQHMIYISDTSCLCLEAKLPQMGNKIYFPRLLHSENTKIVFYSLETHRYHTFDDKNIQESFGSTLFRTKRHCHSDHTWIEPSWS